MRTHPLKPLLALLAAVVLPLSPALAQGTPHYVYIPQPVYHHYNTTPAEPWKGTTLFSLHGGTGLLEDPFRTPLHLALRMAGEKEISDLFAWGWHNGIEFTRVASSTTADGDLEPLHTPEGNSEGHWILNDNRTWSLTYTARLELGYRPWKPLALKLSAGIYYNLLSYSSTDLRFEDKTTGQLADIDHDAHLSGLFDFRFGVSLQAEVQYYLNYNLFLAATAELKTPFSSDRFAYLNTTQYYFMLGLGYTFHKNSNKP